MGYIITKRPTAAGINVNQWAFDLLCSLSRTYRDRDAHKCSLLQCWAGVGNEISKNDTNYHCEEDPDREKPVEYSHALEKRGRFL